MNITEIKIKVPILVAITIVEIAEDGVVIVVERVGVPDVRYALKKGDVIYVNPAAD